MMKATAANRERLDWSGSGGDAAWRVHGDPLQGLERGTALQMAERPGMTRRVVTMEAITALDSLPRESDGNHLWLGLAVLLTPLVLVGGYLYSIGFLS